MILDKRYVTYTMFSNKNFMLRFWFFKKFLDYGAPDFEKNFSTAEKILFSEENSSTHPNND